MLKKKLLSLLAAVAVVCGLVGCQADVYTGQVDTEQTEQATEQTVQTTEQTTAQTEQTAVQTEQIEQTVENVETSETETSAESGDNAAETVIIAGQEFSVDETDVVIYITNDFELTTDISEIGKLKKLESLSYSY